MMNSELHTIEFFDSWVFGAGFGMYVRGVRVQGGVSGYVLGFVFRGSRSGSFERRTIVAMVFTRCKKIISRTGGSGSLRGVVRSSPREDRLLVIPSEVEGSRCNIERRTTGSFDSASLRSG